MADTTRVTVPVENLRAELHDHLIAARRRKSLTVPKDLGRRLLSALSAAPAPEGGAVGVAEVLNAHETCATFDKRAVPIGAVLFTSAPEKAELLRPFAEAAESLDDDTPDASNIWEMPAAMCITAGDLRRVKSVLATREEASAEVGEQWLWRVPGRGWVLCDREDDVVREVRVEGEYVETEVVALSALRAQPQAPEGAQPDAGAKLAKAMWGVDLAPATRQDPDALRVAKQWRAIDEQGPLTSWREADWRSDREIKEWAASHRIEYRELFTTPPAPVDEKMWEALKHYACSCKPGRCAMSCDDTDIPVDDVMCGRRAAEALATLQAEGGA